MPYAGPTIRANERFGRYCGHACRPDRLNEGEALLCVWFEKCVVRYRAYHHEEPLLHEDIADLLCRYTNIAHGEDLFGRARIGIHFVGDGHQEEMYEPLIGVNRFETVVLDYTNLTLEGVGE